MVKTGWFRTNDRNCTANVWLYVVGKVEAVSTLMIFPELSKGEIQSFEVSEVGKVQELAELGGVDI